MTTAEFVRRFEGPAGNLMPDEIADLSKHGALAEWWSATADPDLMLQVLWLLGWLEVDREARERALRWFAAGCIAHLESGIITPIESAAGLVCREWLLGRTQSKPHLALPGGTLNPMEPGTGYMAANLCSVLVRERLAGEPRMGLPPCEPPEPEAVYQADLLRTIVADSLPVELRAGPSNETGAGAAGRGARVSAADQRSGRSTEVPPAAAPAKSDHGT